MGLAVKSEDWVSWLAWALGHSFTNSFRSTVESSWGHSSWGRKNSGPCFHQPFGCFFVMPREALSVWLSRDDFSTCMLEGFKEPYSSTWVILYCTEIFVQTPTSLLLQSQLYSTYKSNTIFKELIGVTPNGAISFVSSLYTGSISDKEISRCCRILDLWDSGDSVMADKGFDINVLPREPKVQLIIPPFLES